MGKQIQTHLRAQAAKALLKRVVGTHGWAVLLVVLMVVLLNWFAAGTRDFVYQILDGRDGSIFAHMIDILVFPVALFMLYWFARRAPSTQRPRIKQFDNPRQARALIIFLSPPPARPHLVYEVVEGESDAVLSDTAFLAALGRIPWRMPLEAIAYHADRLRAGGESRLEHVVVIGSSDRFHEDGRPSGGTYRDVETFRQFVTTLAKNDPALCSFDVRGLHELVGGSRAGRRPATDYSRGVEFERPQELEEAVYDAFDALQRLGIRDHEILVDVTGGQKPASVAGAVVALGKDRMIQYVSTHDYRVRAYDVTMDE